MSRVESYVSELAQITKPPYSREEFAVRRGVADCLHAVRETTEWSATDILNRAICYAGHRQL